MNTFKTFSPLFYNLGIINASSSLKYDAREKSPKMLQSKLITKKESIMTNWKANEFFIISPIVLEIPIESSS